MHRLLLTAQQLAILITRVDAELRGSQSSGWTGRHPLALNRLTRSKKSRYASTSTAEWPGLFSALWPHMARACTP